RPALMPTGSGPDLIHHLALIVYIEQHWTLVHDLRLSEYLGEMIDYTPGVHLLAALAGAWLRADGLHALHGGVSATVAVKAAFILLIAGRLIAPSPAGDPFAVGAVLLLLVPYVYSVGSFTEQSYLAQVASELFAVAMWWALIVWDEQPSAAFAVLFGAFGVAAFLTWPVWTGPLLLVWCQACLARARHVPGTIRDFAIGVVPILAIAALHGSMHPGGFRMVGTGGFAIWPTTATVGRWFYAAAAVALVVAAPQRRARVTVLLLVAIALQAAVLTRTAHASGAAAPYLALKMFYLAIYPMAVLIAAAGAALWQIVAMRVPRLQSPAVAWIIVAALGVAAVRPIAAATRPKPILSEPVLQ